MSLFIGVDVGGTKVLAAEVTRTGRLRRTARRSTPGRRVDSRMVEDALTEAVFEVADGRPITGVGIAAAGFVDAPGERVMFAPHLPWVDEPVRSRLAKRWGTTVALDNDANCAARAEIRYGAAVGVLDAIVVTLGTGIGGAVVIDGRVLRGRNGMAGEFGHMQVVPNGASCECGGRGCWEQYSSGNALVRHVHAANPANLSITGPMITEAAAAGDPIALAAFQSVGQWLGIGLANMVAAFDPELVVVGGGVAAAGDLLLTPAREALSASLVGSGHRQLPLVLPAEFGPEAGAIGGAQLAREFAARRLRLGLGHPANPRPSHRLPATTTRPRPKRRSRRFLE